MASGDEVRVVVRDVSGAVEGARVCILNDADLYAYARTDASGTALISVSTASMDSLLLTLTAPNHLPLTAMIAVSPGGKRLAWGSYEVTDGKDAQPNPARSGVRLVTAACAGEVTFEIFDIRGRLVAAIVKAAGMRSARWDLKNSAGNRVTPGIYLARVRGTPTSQARKIIVLR